MIFISRKRFDEEVFKRVNTEREREEAWRNRQDIEKRLCDLEFRVNNLERPVVATNVVTSSGVCNG